LTVTINPKRLLTEPNLRTKTLQPKNLFAGMCECYVFRFSSRKYNDRMPPTHPNDRSTEYIEQISTGRPFAINISSLVVINKTMYINLPMRFMFPLVEDRLICCSTQVLEYSLECSPMLFSGCRRVSIQYSHCLGNTRSSTYQ